MMSENVWKQTGNRHAVRELSALLEMSCVSNCQLLKTGALWQSWSQLNSLKSSNGKR